MIAPLELWVGPECTVNRVGESWRDQCVETGFATRSDDLDRLAKLGAARMRLPLLWERTVGAEPDALRWGWADAAMARARQLDLPTIVGLLHHGSGPAFTHLLDPDFAHQFIRYAARVAERYPEQRDWTPINEPLTTARFSCLYGHWFPHHRDDRSFVRALLTQVQATVGAMRAIRAVHPAARLIQTEDLGFTQAAPRLQAQADFDNERRWLSFDLLCGRVDRGHPLWRYLRDHGAQDAELDALAAEPCPPDVHGLNIYVTSERYLDDRVHLYPLARHGGNGRDRYVDIETARALGPGIDGFLPRLMEAWRRYGRPLALTEVHLGCTREEQMRWLLQAWQAAQTARSLGVDVRAVTAWAAFGAVDWDSLLVHPNGHYEPGLWDVRGTTPRLTGLGRLARALAQGAKIVPEPAHGTGWWQRDLRHEVAPVGPVEAMPCAGCPLLILGNNRVADHLQVVCDRRGLPHARLTTATGGPLDRRALERAIEDTLLRESSWALIDAAACDADAGQRGAESTVAAQAEQAASLAATCERLGMVYMALLTPDRWELPTHRCGCDAPDAIAPTPEFDSSQLGSDCAAARLIMLLDSSGEARASDQSSPPAAQDPAAGGNAASTPLPEDLTGTLHAVIDLLIDGERGVWRATAGRVFERICTTGQAPRRTSEADWLASQHDVLLPGS